MSIGTRGKEWDFIFLIVTYIYLTLKILIGVGKILAKNKSDMIFCVNIPIHKLRTLIYFISFLVQIVNLLFK